MINDHIYAIHLNEMRIAIFNLALLGNKQREARLEAVFGSEHANKFHEKRFHVPCYIRFLSLSGYQSS